MRVVTWNCNLSLSRKLPRILALEPDLAVIQECERDLQGLPDGAQYVWVGNNPRKGLGVISFGQPISVDDAHRDTWSYFLPVNVPGLRLKLLATWAYHHRAARFSSEHNGRPLSVFGELNEWLSAGPTIIAGDFNNSVVWDKLGNPNNFETSDIFLNRLGLRSVYHDLTGETLGKENAFTYFHTKNTARPFHIDYVYASHAIPAKTVSVGSFADWRAYSDHVPVIVETETF